MKSERSTKRSLVWIGCAVLAFALAGQLIAEYTPRPNSRALRNQWLYGLTGVIRGRVTYPDGSPASGLTVGAGFAMHKTGAVGEGTAMTTKDGRYELSGLAADRFVVGVATLAEALVASPRKNVDIRSVKVADHIDFTVQSGPSVTVHTLDTETGAPIPGISVSLDPTDNGATMPVGVTDHKGQFRTRLGSLKFLVSIGDRGMLKDYSIAPGYSAFHRFDLYDVKPVNVWIKLYSESKAISMARTFKGDVVDEQGRPVAGAIVQMARGGNPMPVTTNKSGEFTLNSYRLRQDEAAVVFQALRGDLCMGRLVSAEETWGKIHLVVKRQGASIGGQIIDDRGRPLPDCPLSCLAVYPQNWGIVCPVPNLVTDQKGRFLASGLPPDAGYLLQPGNYAGAVPLGNVFIPPRSRSQKVIHVSPNSKVDLGKIVVPRATAKLEIVLRDQNGKAIPKDVLLTLKGNHTSSTASLQANGRYLADHLVNEPLRLSGFVGENGAYNAGEDSPNKLFSLSVRPGRNPLNIKVKMRPVKAL